jgi:8-oxo-dGTP pyrophosphatase MutT (NUDIX family)
VAGTGYNCSRLLGRSAFTFDTGYPVSYFIPLIMPDKNPWTILSSKEVYDNNWIQVVAYDVLNPSGGKGIYGKVHFKNTAIGIIVLDEDLNTYLVGQYRFVLDAYSWEIPEGGGASDEVPLDAAKRELEEETGLVASEWTQIAELHLSNSVTDEHCILFLARQLKQKSAKPEETEQLAIKKLPFEEAWQMTQDGRITDVMSVVAFQKVKWMLHNGTLK